jgi:hypothetical protein
MSSSSQRILIACSVLLAIACLCLTVTGALGALIVFLR